jgi:hypothetical protein
MSIHSMARIESIEAEYERSVADLDARLLADQIAPDEYLLLFTATMDAADAAFKLHQQRMLRA